MSLCSHDLLMMSLNTQFINSDLTYTAPGCRWYNINLLAIKVFKDYIHMYIRNMSFRGVSAHTHVVQALQVHACTYVNNCSMNNT